MNAAPDLTNQIDQLLETETFLCFSLKTETDYAAEQFKKRFGRYPDLIIDHLGLLRLGPVPHLDPEVVP